MNISTHLRAFISCTSRKQLLTTAAVAGLTCLVQNSTCAAIVNVSTAAQLTTAVNSGLAGDTINVAAGTYLLTASLKPKANMIIQGAGSSTTILRADVSWNPGSTGLPGDPVVSSTVVRTAYMFDFGGNDGIILSDLTLDGIDQLHGATYGYDSDNLELCNLFVKDFLMNGFRSFSMSGSSIHDCVLEDAGGTWTGQSGGGIFATWVDTSTFYNNRIYRSAGSTRDYYGIKGRQVVNCRMYNNTILLSGFSIECAHENDADVEIDHNYLMGTISVPKGGGGSVPVSGTTYHIHHNYFRKSYALEWARRGAEIDNNLFDFATTSDTGNLISNFDTIVSTGGTKFHDNLIKNPGRGLYWGDIAYNNFSFYNNHVIANTTVTPRTEGLFDFEPTTTFSTITVKDNIFECIGQTRPLFRNSACYASVIQNNTLTGITDSANYSNANTGATRGPLAPLFFTCGNYGEYTVNGWNVASTVPLSVTTSPTSGTYNLTSTGTLDWAKWGRAAVGDFDHKATGGTTISNWTAIGGSPNRSYSATVGHTWTDGTPTASLTGATGYIRTGGAATKGFEFTVVPSGAAQTLDVYLGTQYSATGVLTVSLDDNSQTPVTLNLTAVESKAVVQFAASSATRLRIRYVTLNATGNVFLRAAALR